MDEALRAAYRATAYLVCLDAAQWPCIAIDQVLPAALQALVGEHAWGFITAWNPRSVPRSAAKNTAAQRSLLAALQQRPDLVACHVGIGIGANGWYEPSLFVIGLEQRHLDDLCNEHAQNAYVCGLGHGTAQLRMLRA